MSKKSEKNLPGETPLSKKSDKNLPGKTPPLPSKKSVEDIFGEKGEEAIQVAIQKAIEQAFAKTSEHPKKNEVNRIVKEATVEIKSVAFTMSGPLPMPAMLAHYEKILPGAAERIMKMAEEESRHRRDMDLQAVSLETVGMKSVAFSERLGSIFGLIIALVAISIGGYAALKGAETFGTTLAGGTLVSLVGVFVYGRKKD